MGLVLSNFDVYFLHFRNRIQTVKVDPSTIQTSPVLLIRPTAGVSNTAQNGNSNGLDKQSLLKSLSNKPTCSKSKDRATEIVNLFQKNEEQFSSYQNENLPVVGFSNTNGSSEK
jgi:hypothetical protein